MIAVPPGRVPGDSSKKRTLSSLVPWLLILQLWVVGAIQASSDLESCLDAQALVRVARVVAPDGSSVYARVIAHEDGRPTVVVPIAEGDFDLAVAFERAIDVSSTAPSWQIPAPDSAERICAPISLSQDAIDAESHVVVAAGLNYAAHAEEAGGGDVFLFPKPVAPGRPYGDISAPSGVTLLAYEVELGFVLLADVDLRALPSSAELLAQTAFFVANDITDRSPIIKYKALAGPGMGFVEGKGQPGFFPAGPWLVGGSDLFTALATCGADGLGIRLEVDEGHGFRMRQEATTAAMILDPRQILALVADEVMANGIRTSMPVRRAGGVRHYPFAVEAADGKLLLSAGSVVLTGTPEGVAMATAAPVGLIARGLLRLRSPFEQFRQEEIARAAKGTPGGYLEPGDRVRAHVDGLGTQIIHVETAGTSTESDACSTQASVSSS